MEAKFGKVSETTMEEEGVLGQSSSDENHGGARGECDKDLIRYDSVIYLFIRH